jgi:hypothetical protein
VSNSPVTKTYTADLKQALSDLLHMSSERAQLETKIAKQKKRVAALYELVQADEDGPALSGLVEGISDACRVVLRAAEKPLTPAEVRDAVQGLGLPPQANLLASVHTTLKRMKEAGEAKEVNKPLESGGTGAAYEWVDARMISLASLLGTPLDINLVPENIRGLIQPGKGASHPMEKLKAPKPPLTPVEAKRMMDTLRPKK